MDTPRPCGCKGCRTCLICEEQFKITSKLSDLTRTNSYIYCPYCNKGYPGWNLNSYKSHPNHPGEPIDYPGIFIDLNFLTEQEEQTLVDGLDTKIPWDLSQSGRRKQNFGPKCNFKKRKLRLGSFAGFPLFTKFVQDKFKDVEILKTFQTIEQCSLEYDPVKGASIDPHIDDCWIWGERIVTVNLLADSVLTMTYNDKPNRYNLDCVKDYSKIVDINGDQGCYVVQPMEDNVEYPIFRIPMPRRSLLVMYGSARYDWEHRILREDIVSRRICLAYREFTPPYLDNGKYYREAEDVFIKAKEFWD